jgi:phage gpG-like protein
MQQIRVRVPLGSFGDGQLVVSIKDEQALQSIQALRERLAAPAPLWGRVGEIMRRSFAQDFASGGRPAWAPLSPRTVAEKTGLFRKGKLPPKTPTGRLPRRLLQNGNLGPTTILIRSGALRDSWVQKNARGHVEEIGGDGSSFFIGSQLTVEQPLKASKPVKRYHVKIRPHGTLRLRKRDVPVRDAGGTVNVRIPLAVFHELGTRRMPARKVAVLQAEDQQAIEAAAARWVAGETP